MATVADDVKGFDDVRMFECGTNTKFCGNLLLVLLFGLGGTFGPELLNSKYSIRSFSLDKPNSTAGAGTEDSAGFAILLRKVGLCGFRERGHWVRDLSGSFCACGCVGDMRNTRVDAAPGRLEVLGRRWRTTFRRVAPERNFARIRRRRGGGGRSLSLSGNARL